jgi:hypothetical protein
VINPLASLTDAQLWNSQLLLQLACGKAHQALAHKRQQYFCTLFRLLKIEADVRGLPSPAAPFYVGDLKPGAL